MESISEGPLLQWLEWTAEPLHVFTDDSGTGMELQVYPNHLELHSDGGKEVLAVWYRHIRKVTHARQNGSDALAIVDRGGQVLVVPMGLEGVDEARWLITGLMAWQERSHR
jgi:hypothetical protein